MVDRFEDFPRQFPLALMAYEDIDTELRNMEAALPKAAQADINDVEEHQWEQWMQQLIDRIGVTPEIDIVAAWGRKASDLQLSAIRHRLAQARRAARKAALEDRLEDERITGFLVPVSFAQRLQWVLGFGVLPVCWTRRLDVPRF